MNDADKPYFAGVMNDLGSIYSRDITQDLVRVYWEILCYMERAHFERALKAVYRTAEFFPKPRDFIAGSREGWK